MSSGLQARVKEGVTALELAGGSKGGSDGESD